MNIIEFFYAATDRNMFHEYPSRQSSPVSESRLHPPRSARTGQHRPPFLLSDHARPTPPLPLHPVRQNPLLDHRHPVLPAPQSPGAFR